MLETLALMGHGFVNAMSLSNLLFMAGGTAIGIIIGCLPGLSAAMGVALLVRAAFRQVLDHGRVPSRPQTACCRYSHFPCSRSAGR